MLLLLAIIPVLAGLTSLFLYRHNGKKDLFKMDLVQFFYGFVLFPVMFVWLKSFLFLILSREVGVKLSMGQIFMVDTIFSLLFLFVFAFEIIHILTKDFSLKFYRDPLYDLFEHSEYYHLWLSHVGMHWGLMLIAIALGIMNVFVPFDLNHVKMHFYGALGLGVLVGLLGFIGVWLSNFEYPQYTRLMKLGFGASFFTLVVAYFVFDPDFRLPYALFWVMLVGFATTVACSFLFEKSEKAKITMDKFKHKKWNYRCMTALKKEKA